jgi:hypothetical protein
MANFEKGINDLATVNPELAKEWHPTKNGDLTPDMVNVDSNRKVWWQLPYDDPKTGEHFDFEWEATVANRNKGMGCPFLNKDSELFKSGQDVLSESAQTETTFDKGAPLDGVKVLSENAFDKPLDNTSINTTLRTPSQDDLSI